MSITCANIPMLWNLGGWQESQGLIPGKYIKVLANESENMNQEWTSVTQDKFHVISGNNTAGLIMC